GKVVSIMFIDIVGFSAISESRSPEEVFKYLKDLMDRMRSEIHAHGGVVDRVLGDGLLAFFGYHYDGRKASDDHASQALAAALVIQRQNVEHCLKAGDGDPIFPLRIGINTD